MRPSIAALLLVAVLLGSVEHARSYTIQYADSTATTRIRWTTNTVNIFLSSSLSSPGANIKAGSDVNGAARRALARWSEATGIQFNITSDSGLQSISQSASGDGISLITVANTAENAAVFGGQVDPGRARIFFNPASGGITEADVIINPNLQFSTDGTADTYDLESTLTHEIGHLLGLDHSAVVSATMQPRQGRNGLYGLPATTARALSSDDLAAAQALYGGPQGTGAISGTISLAGGGPAYGAHVWAEDVSTGQIVAGNITIEDGSYSIQSLPAGEYRVVVEYLNEPVIASQLASSRGPYAGLTIAQTPFRAQEIAARAPVAASSTTNLNATVSAVPPALNPRLIGVARADGQVEFSSAPALLSSTGRAETVTVYVGGEGLDSSTIVATSSSFLGVDPASVLFQTGGGLPIISFRVAINPNIPYGDYSIRLQSGSGETAYIAGGLTVEIDARRFVRQQYLDFLNREPDAPGWDHWTGEITICGADAGCADRKRTNTSGAFFLSTEFQSTGYFVYRFYRGSLNRQPGLAEFTADARTVAAGIVVGDRLDFARIEINKQAFADAWVNRADFRSAYDPLSNQAYVDRLFTVTGATAVSNADRQALVAGLINGTETRASVLRKIVDGTRQVREGEPEFTTAYGREFYQRQYNPAFVLMQYFGYLRRDPDESGYQFWLAKLNLYGNFVDAEMVRAFIVSEEYRSRYGRGAAL